MPWKTPDSHGYRTLTVPAPIVIAHEIVDNLESALEQFRETAKSSIWIPGQARNDEFLEVPMDKTSPALSTATFSN